MSRKVQLFFFLGNRKEDGTLIVNTNRLTAEIEKFDDIVIADFLDSYTNLKMKTLAAHSFVNSEYFDSCQSVNWVVFHDDDVAFDYSQLEGKIVRLIKRDIYRFGTDLDSGRDVGIHCLVNFHHFCHDPDI